MRAAIKPVTYKDVSEGRFAKAPDGIDVIITYNVLSADNVAKAPGGIDVIWLVYRYLLVYGTKFTPCAINKRSFTKSIASVSETP